ncbi:MAG: protein kinase [Myxococcales bacterium]|nr:protein kinase [Myxococcales bacterium]
MTDDPNGPPTGTQLGFLPTRTPAVVGTTAPASRNDYASEADLAPPETSASALAPGTKIRHYELIRELGRGGMGVVYAARDLKLGRRVAMKFLRQIDPEVVDRFVIEARATARCNHDNIVIIHEVDEYEGAPYMVLEYLEGKSLRDLMGPFGAGIPMTASRVIELMVSVARALVHAHSLGIVHRDLKPENVLVTSGGTVKVLDFGIAKALAGQARGELGRSSYPVLSTDSSPTLTLAGAMVGTLPYMSPEQLGLEDIDGRSDLFSVGVIMFEMLLGAHPIEPLSREALFANLASSEPMPSARVVLPSIPAALADVIDHCLQKRKADRIHSAEILVERLEALLPNRSGRRLAEGESPFPGLTAFQESDADRFFGRSQEVGRMLAKLRELPLTGIIGPSGVGKSSFVRAGVGPALKASGELWDIITLRPGRHPLAALANVVERWGPGLLGSSEHVGVIERLRHEPGYLGSLLRSRARTSGSHIPLFVDQFEELYTLVPDLEERRAFTAALAAVADDTGAPLRVVVSMRSDFLDRVSEDAAFAEHLSRGLVFLAPPDREGLAEALQAPVEMVGYEFEAPAIVDDMLSSLARAPGALPLLQFAASKLWEARDRERHLLTTASYEAIGGISGALATHADDVVAAMNANARRITQRVLRHLVTPERTRAVVELADLLQLDDQADEVSRAIDQLVAARLLVVHDGGDATGGTVEIVHESLIERWPTLRRWLDEDHDEATFLAEVGAAAKQWDARGRQPGLLWRGAAMEEARRWYVQRPRRLAPREQAFIDAVLALARRGRSLRGIALSLSIVILVGIAGGAMVAYLRVRNAEHLAQQNAEDKQLETTRALDALEQMREKERERQAAADRRARAEAATVSAHDEVKAKDAEVKAKDADLVLTREQLEAQNAKLQILVVETKAAREKAEQASQRAIEAAAAQKQISAQLEQALEVKRAIIAKLEEEKRKLSTQLKE